METCVESAWVVGPCVESAWVVGPCVEGAVVVSVVETVVVGAVLFVVAMVALSEETPDVSPTVRFENTTIPQQAVVNTTGVSSLSLRSAHLLVSNRMWRRECLLLHCQFYYTPQFYYTAQFYYTPNNNFSDCS